MSQSEALQAIVIGFGVLAAGSIFGAMASLIILRRKTDELRRARLGKQA